MKDIKLKISIDEKDVINGIDDISDGLEHLSRVDAKNAKQALDALDRTRFNNLKNQASELKATFTSFAGNIASTAVSNLSQKLYEGARAVAEYSTNLQATKLGFESLTGSAAKAEQLFKQIQDLSKRSPFEFQGLADLGQRLLGANVQLEKITPLLSDIGNVVAATGKATQDRLEGVTVAISQMIAKGKVSAEEMEQLSERGVPAWQILAESIGKSVGQTRELAEQGKITSDVMVRALQKIGSEKYGDAMEKQSRIGANAITSIKDILTRTAADYFKPLYDEASKFAVNFAESLKKNEDEAKSVAFSFGEAVGKSYAQGVAKGRDGGATGIVVSGDTSGIIGALANQFAQFYTGVQSGANIQKSIADMRKMDDSIKSFKDNANNLPDLRKELNAQAAATEVKELKKQSDFLSNMVNDLRSRIMFFGQETELSATRQKLWNEGIYDFNSAQAQSALSLATTLDKITANQKALDEYNDKLKSSSDYMKDLRETSRFEFRVGGNASELQKFDFWVKQNAESFAELKSEIEATRFAIEMKMWQDSFSSFKNAALEAFQELDSEIGSLTRETSKFEDALTNFFVRANIKQVQFIDEFGGTPRSLSETAKNYAAVINDYLSKIEAETNASKIADLSSELDKFLRTIQGSKGDNVFDVFGKEGTGQSVSDFIDLLLKLRQGLKNAEVDKALKVYESSISDLDSEIRQLNVDLGLSTELSKVDAVAKVLQTEAYKGLTKEQKDSITAKAQEIDQLKASVEVQKQYEDALQKTADVFENVIDAAIAKDWKGVLDSIFGELKRFLVRAAAEWLASKFFKLLGGAGFGSQNGGGQSSGFGNILQTIFGGGGSTPPFSPNGSGGSSGGFSLQGAGSAFGGLNVNPNNPFGLSGGGRAGGGGFFGAGGIFGEEGFGNNVGTYGAIGAGAGLLGNLIGGRVGGFISGAGGGLAMGAQIGTMFMPGIGTAIGAGIGALVGGLMSLFGGDPKRKADKKENLPALQKNLNDSLAQLRALAADKNAFLSDPEGVLSKALELRQFIASGTGVKMESKKYRAIAQQQIQARLAEADRIIEGIRSERDGAIAAKSIDERLNANFATGAYMSPEFLKQYGNFKRRNGILPGAFTGRDQLPSMLASGEMVLNPKQILSVLRNAGGYDVFKNAGIPGYRDGAFIQPAAPRVNPSPSFAANQQIIFQPNITIQIQGEGITKAAITDVLVDGIKNNQNVRVEIVKANKKEGLRTS